jgi:hypothetical protein
MVGTVKWKIQDVDGKIHNFILPDTHYLPKVETRLLSQQHWAQVKAKKRDAYCITYYDAIIMRGIRTNIRLQYHWMTESIEMLES